MTNRKNKPSKTKPRKMARPSGGKATQKTESGLTQRMILSNMRHELRTPLNAIIGYSEMLMEDAEDLGQDVLIPDLKKICSAGKEMLGLLKEILDPANMEKEEGDRYWDDLEAKLEHSLRDPLDVIIGRSESLVETARDVGQEAFIPDLNKILSASKNFLRLSKELCSFLKDKAVVGDSEYKIPDSSAMIKDVVSRIPPLWEEEVPSMEAERYSVLVVEDNEMNRDLLTRHLERQGHIIRTAENGRQALEIMKEESFDLVLLDVLMPEMNGYQVLKRLKQEEGWRDIPVIMISALEERDIVVRCIEMGADDYMGKPFNPVFLKARINSCLERKRLRDMERMHADQALRESEEKYQTILPNIEDGYYEVDLAGNMTFFNDSMCRILGYSGDELKGMNNRQYMSEDTAKLVYQTFSEVHRTGKPSKGFDWELIRKDGEKRFLETSVSLIRDPRGLPVGFRGIARDITQRKQIIQELESLKQAKEKILSHLSHELITPIGLIEASLERLYKRDLSESLKEKNLRRIQRHLARVKDLQEISQEILYPYQYRPQPFQVETAVEGVLENLQMKSVHREVAIITQLESLITDIIDPRVLKRVADTLVKNAIESTPDEGKIIVSLMQAPKGVRFIVEDHGVGIAGNDLDFVSKGFYHTQHTDFYSTKRPFDFNAGGKGLELMALKILSTEGAFNLSFESKKCRHVPTNLDSCCGRISSCPFITSPDECIESGGTTFSVLFFKKRSQEKM